MTEFSEHRLTQEMTFDPSSTAVLVVDMLNDLCEPEGAMPLPDGELLYRHIQSLLEAARAGGQFASA
jgi:nicotinamidase-related amidase